MKNRKIILALTLLESIRGGILCQGNLSVMQLGAGLPANHGCGERFHSVVYAFCFVV